MAEPAKPATRYTLGQRIWTGCLAVLGVMAVWAGMISHFVPTPQGDLVALACAVVAAATAAFYAWKHSPFAVNPRHGAEGLGIDTGYEKLSVRIPSAACLVFVLTFMATQRCALDWWTSITGVDGDRVDHVSQYRSSGRRTCAGFELQEAPWFLGPAICTYQSGLANTAPGSPVTLSGKLSPFGIVVRDYEVAAPQ